MMASTAVLLRAGMVAALAMGAVGVAGRARAESPIEFWTAQAQVQQKAAGHAGHGKIGKFRAKLQVSREREGLAPQTDVIREASRFIGSGNITGHSGAWCAWFVSFVLERIGHRPLSNGLSYSALSYGPRLAGPRVGALIVLPRHVGFVAGVSGDRVTMLSGNWSGRVALAVLPIRAAIAYIEVN